MIRARQIRRCGQSRAAPEGHTTRVSDQPPLAKVCKFAEIRVTDSQIKTRNASRLK
jgi:hypothetical protein